MNFYIWFKVAFFQKVRFVFQISLNFEFKIPTKNSIMLLTGILNFKYRIVFGIFIFEDLHIWKTTHTSWKKPPLETDLSTLIAAFTLALV